MAKEEKLYLEIGSKLNPDGKSQMFGKPCYKVNGKAFMCFFQDEIVFKLSGESHKKALSLKNARLFDPSGKNRPMKEWVQIPFVHAAKWEEYARSAFIYVKENS